MEKWKLIAILAVAGLFLGALSYNQQPAANGGYCKSLETDLKENKSFNGSVSCYNPPEDSNLSDRIDNRTELRCVCTIEYRGEKRIYPVTVPK